MSVRMGWSVVRWQPSVPGSNGQRDANEHPGGTTVKRTIAEQPVAPSPGRSATAPPTVARPALEPVRTRRRPLLVGLGVALTALGGLGAFWLATTGTGTVTVVGIAKEVRAGDVIQKGDLVGVQVAPGAALRTLSVDHYADVVGKRSLVRLLPGSLLNPDAVADKLVPGAGQALVGLSLGPAQRPAVAFDAGDAVQILYTPANQDPGSSSPPSPVIGTVVSTQDDPDANRLIVNVTVDADSAPKVAIWGSAGRATIVLLPAGQG
jgi:SAF domain